MKRLILSIAVANLLLAGCATKHFGKVTTATAGEAAGWTCADIAVETDKLAAFDERVKRKSRIDAASAVAFIGDFGVGNALAKRAALRSAGRRRAALDGRATTLGCRPADQTLAAR